MRLRAFLGLTIVALAGCPETNPDAFPVPSSPCADFSTPQGYVDALKCSDYKSCAFACTCTEPAKPYQCPAMQPWNAMAHGSTCGLFDGTTYPPPEPGACTATAPSAGALSPAGLDLSVPGRYHIADGHFIQPAGHEQVIHAQDVTSAFLVDMVLVPGTHFAVLVDAGVEDNALYTIDLDKLAADAPALVSDVRFASPLQIDYGLAFVAPNEVYASGAGNGKLFAFTIDLSTGALARDTAKDFDLGPASAQNAPSRWYAGGIALTGDPTKMVVAPTTNESAVRLVDLTTAGTTPAWIDIDVSPARELFGVFPDPNDTTGNTFWVTTYDTRELLRVDLASKQVGARYKTGKNPEGALLTTKHALVANSDDDTITVFDAPTGNVVQTLDLDAGSGLTGLQPSVLAYDPALKRVYAALSGVNAIGVYAYDDAQPSPLTVVGEIPSAWWPTALRLEADGSIIIATAKGHGTGPATGTANCPDLTKGSVQLVSPPPTDQEVQAMTATVAASRAKTSNEGFPSVTCPPNTLYDFPIPLTNTGAPSTRIQYVVYVVRENKTFDSVFGDLQGVDGDPQNVLSPGRMDEVWANARSIAQKFTNFDNYYIAAEQSLQGHIWTSFGRSTDYIERAWSSEWGRSVRTPKAGLDVVFGSPGEGSLFTWAERNSLTYQNMGEIVGIGTQSFDPAYPGFVYNNGVPDTEKGCYIAARARALCDMKPLTYVVLPNDHTKGTDPGAPTPDIMIAVNDVGTGMIVDAISHSPMWPSTLIIVTEDDPQSGEDHVDAHRTPLFMASPWVKRGYVSHDNLGTASIHKLIANVFAKPYQSESVASAAIPFDAFTNTPDYTPYSFSPLQTQVACNPQQDRYVGPPRDWTLPDNQPGVDREVAQYFRKQRR